MKLNFIFINIILTIFINLYNINTSFSQDSASIIMYHRFGEPRYPSTNIQIERFKKHLEELENPKYNVLGLLEIVNKLKAGKSLPDYAVGISIDDAFLSVYQNAWPILQNQNIPFTLFVATDPIDQGLSGYMSWDQIRELKKNGVEIGSQTKSHPHMHKLTEKEIRKEINYSNSRFEEELGEIPKLFAYPYGEYNLVAKKVAKETFVASFGQHSGSAHPSIGFHELPRFAMNESYGSLDRFLLAAGSLPFVVSEIHPKSPVVSQNPPSYGFTIEKDFPQIDQLQCFISGIGEAQVTLIGKRVEVRSDELFYRPRHRINCTFPGPEGRWHWFGRQFLLN